MKIIADASPLIGLARIERLDILYQLFEQIIVPPAVADECTEFLKKPGAFIINEAIEHQKIKVYQEKFVLIEALRSSLDKGETEAISLAVQLKNLLLIDERRGRFFAKSYQVSITGLGGLLLLAKNNNIIHSVKTILDELALNNYHLSDSVCHEIIRCADE